MIPLEPRSYENCNADVLATVRERVQPVAETWDRLDSRRVYGSPLLDRLRAQSTHTLTA